MGDTITLTGGEYITDLTGATWIEIDDEGEILIQFKKNKNDDWTEVCNPVCPAGKEWKARISLNITQTDE